MDHFAAGLIELPDESSLAGAEKEWIQLDHVHQVRTHQRLHCRLSRVPVVDDDFVELARLGASCERRNQRRGWGGKDAEKDAATLRQIAQHQLRSRQPTAI